MNRILKARQAVKGGIIEIQFRRELIFLASDLHDPSDEDTYKRWISSPDRVPRRDRELANGLHVAFSLDLLSDYPGIESEESLPNYNILKEARKPNVIGHFWNNTENWEKQT